MPIILIVGLSILIFVTDMMTPLGVAGGVPHIAAVLFAYKLQDRKAIPFVAVLGSALTILAFFLSPPGGEVWQVLTNRFLSLFAIWAVAIACMKIRIEKDRLHIFTDAINQSPNPIAITDKDIKIEYVNTAFLQKTGYSEKELLGNNPRILKSGKHSADFYRKLWETIRSGNVWKENIFNKRKNGTLYWESLQICPLKNTQGEITHFFSLRLLDKQMEAVNKEINTLSHTLDQIPQAVLITDRQGFIVYANPGFEKITGYSLNEVVGMNPNVLKSESQTPEFYKKLWAAILTGNSWRGELLNKKKNGELYWEKVVISPIYSDENIITHFIALRDDITKEKSKDFKFEKIQKQLIASEKLAGIGQLAAGVSHEVLNPINIISVHTQMLQRKTKDDDNIQNYCNKVKHEIERIQKIMGSLLAFSRKNKTEFEKGNIRESIEAVLTLLEEEYKLDNIKVVRDWCDSLEEISFDSDKIRQVYLNLVHNAKHAMPDGGTITVGCREIKEGGKDFHQFTFSDTGAGMSEEVRLKIFEPFFTTKPEGEGTGMGLAVIHGIIQEHGGKIRAESEEGKGTTFIISLPIA
jgi:PAS domain S-box-containing protein